jgi:hypothetical protein
MRQIKAFSKEGVWMEKPIKRGLGKWAGFQGKGYAIENLGRPAIFLIPVKKLSLRFVRRTVGQEIHRFLIAEFGAYTSTTIPSFGFWRDGGQAVIHDACCQYEVSFVGKERIPLLLAKLARIAEVAGEDCIYFKAGQYTCTVRPA